MATIDELNKIDMGLLKERISQILNSEQNEGQSFLSACNEIWLLLDEMIKELILPKPYKHRTHYHKDYEVKTTSYLDADIEAFKEKLEKWLKPRGSE